MDDAHQSLDKLIIFLCQVHVCCRASTFQRSWLWFLRTFIKLIAYFFTTLIITECCRKNVVNSNTILSNEFLKKLEREGKYAITHCPKIFNNCASIIKTTNITLQNEYLFFQFLHCEKFSKEIFFEDESKLFTAHTIYC